MEIELRIYNVEDRLDVAKILVKNGYTVSQVKRSCEGKKAAEYRLRIEESSGNASIAK